MAEILVANQANQMSIYEETYREQLDNRILVLRDVDETTLDEIVMYILKWNREDLNLPKENRIPIRLYISTPGGNVFERRI